MVKEGTLVWGKKVGRGTGPACCLGVGSGVGNVVALAATFFKPEINIT